MHLAPYMQLPFKPLGRDHTGVDCYGLCYLIAREQLGIEIPSYADGYTTTNDSAEIAAIINLERSTTWEQIYPPAVKTGDLVVLRIIGHPWHCGLVLDVPRFIHTEENVNVCIDSLASIRWSRRVEGFFRWKGAA